MLSQAMMTHGRMVSGECALLEQGLCGHLRQRDASEYGRKCKEKIRTLREMRAKSAASGTAKLDQGGSVLGHWGRNGAGVPVLVGLAAFDAPHVEP